MGKLLAINLDQLGPSDEEVWKCCSMEVPKVAFVDRRIAELTIASSIA